jgi:hypothetical protein
MPNMLEIARLLTMGAKSPVPKRKRRILKDAVKELDRLESYKTARTKVIEKATGAKSDIEKRKKEVARQARKKLKGQ